MDVAMAYECCLRPKRSHVAPRPPDMLLALRDPVSFSPPLVYLQGSVAGAAGVNSASPVASASAGAPSSSSSGGALGSASSSASLQNDATEVKGWLYKWTNYVRGYQKRWFVLSNGLLSYYRSQGEMAYHSRASIALSGASIQVRSIPCSVSAIIYLSHIQCQYSYRGMRNSTCGCLLLSPTKLMDKGFRGTDVLCQGNNSHGPLPSSCVYCMERCLIPPQSKRASRYMLGAAVPNRAFFSAAAPLGFA